MVDNIAAPDPALFASAKLAHHVAACAIAALVALYIAGALTRHWIDRHEVLKRMLPGGA